ncbi:MAG: zeta toxin family protein [Nanoarchaeota archaeon]|nr:zeta toxin family protein [Nanoarchaeota archaeon]
MVKLIILRGPPGSGKSTLALLVAKKLSKGTIVIPKDTVNYGFHFVNIKQKKDRSKATIKEIVKYYLKNNYNVIVEGVFGGRDANKKINEMKTLSDKFNGDFYLVSLNVKLKTSILRDDIRKKKISKKEVTKWYNYFYLGHIKSGLILDNDKLTINKAVKSILEYLPTTLRHLP